MWSEFHDLRDDEKRANFAFFEARKQQLLQASPMAHGISFKPGARVCMTYNEPVDESNKKRRYVNGDCGVLLSLHTDTGEKIKQTETPANPFMAMAADAEKPDNRKICYMRIKLDRGRTILVGEIAREVMDVRGNVEASIVGFPARLGWAMTINKAQGMTVDRAVVSIESIRNIPAEGRHGLAYVALSRTRTLDGLVIRGWDPSVVYCDPVVIPFL